MGDMDLVSAPLPDWLCPASERGDMHVRRLLAKGEPGAYIDQQAARPMLHRSHLPLLPGSVTAAARVSVALPPLPAGFTPRPWQPEGAQFVADRRGSILGFEMRMGKGPAVLMSHDPADGPLWITAPLVVRSYWEQWCKVFFPDLPFYACAGRGYDPAARGAPIVFCHYDILQLWQGLAMGAPPALVIWDEPHILANYKSDRAQTCKMIQAVAKRCVGLTGTPLWAKPRQLHNVLQATVGNAFGTGFRDYAIRYCAGHPGPHGLVADGVSHAEELAARLAEVILVKNWAGVGMPPVINRKVIKVPVDGTTCDKLEAELENLRGDVSTEVGDLSRYRRLLGKIKARAAVDDLLNGDESPCVVWTYHKDTAKLVAKLLEEATGGTVAQLHGDMTDAQRTPVLEAWKRGELGPFIVSTTSVAQVGIDMSRAAREAFVEVNYVPISISQAEMRPFAPGRALDVTFYVAEHPVDDGMTRVLVDKLDAARELSMPTAEAITALVESGSGNGMPADMNELARQLLED